MLALSLLVFTSCSKDDDEENPFGKQVRKITYSYSGSSSYDYLLFEYDNQGRVIKETEHEIDGDEKYIYINKYTYGNDVITHESSSNSSSEDVRTTTYHLSNGVITHSAGHREATYSYNDKKELIKFDGWLNFTYKWNNGNIVAQEGSFNETYSYSTMENKTIGINYFIDNIPNNILFSYGYFGAKNKNLMKFENTEYDLDKDGYVTEIRYYDINSDGTKKLNETNTYEYK